MKREGYVVSRCLVFAGLLIACLPANANMYSCKDIKGARLVQNSPDGCVSEVCEIKANGTKDCAETKEQRQEREEKEKKKHDCEKKIRDELLKAYGFLDRYPKRENIDNERDRKLAKRTAKFTRPKNDATILARR